MASTGAKKRQTIHNTVRIQKEKPPTCGKAIPTYGDQNTGNQKWTKYSELATPQLNSVLHQKQEIEEIEALKPCRYTTTENLTPRTKTAIMPKINQRLNFDVSRPVFRNLMPINVNDSLLLPKERTSIRKKYTCAKSNKPPAPDLADFLDPIKPLTHVIPLPQTTLEFPKYKFDPMEIYKRLVDNSLLEQSIPSSGIK